MQNMLNVFYTFPDNILISPTLDSQTLCEICKAVVELDWQEIYEEALMRLHSLKVKPEKRSG